MTRFGFRPRFRAHLPEGREELVSRVKSQMRRSNPAELKLRRVGSRLVLRFPSHLSRVWTPQIEVHLADLPGGGTLLRARIGPSFRIWRFFRGALLAFMVCGVLGLSLAFFQWANGAGGVWGFYLVFGSLAGGLFLYFLSEQGKRRARDEMDLLMAFMDAALGRDCFRTGRQRRPVGMAGSAA